MYNLIQLSISKEDRIGNVTLGAIDRDGQTKGAGEAVTAGGALQEELDAFLAFSSGGVLLWHDPDGAFEGALGGLSLPDDVTLVREGTSSRFELLCRVNDLAADETLLLYRARRHRVERSDWLADVKAYADCFYESALLSRRRSVSRGHLAGRRIFADSHAQARGRDLVESIVRAEVSLDLEGLLEILRNDYGIPVQRAQIVALVRQTGLFYSPELGRVYRDHDQFVREVEWWRSTSSYAQGRARAGFVRPATSTACP